LPSKIIMQALQYYTDKIASLESELKAIRKRSYLFGWIRLLGFVSSISFFVLYFRFNYALPLLAVALVSFVLFMYFVNRNLRLNDQETFLVNKLRVNKTEVLFLEQQYADRETGNEYTYLNPYLATDFDIFGKGSLYQYLNRCSTRMGKNKLAENLCKSELSNERITAKQHAIRELSEKNDFMQDFQANGMSIPENGREMAGLMNWLEGSDKKLRLLKIVAIALALINILWIILAAVGILTWTSLILPIFVSLAVIGYQTKKISSAHSQLAHVAKTFEKYTTLFKSIENEEFKSPYLIELQQQFSSGHYKASRALAALFKLLNLFDIRDNVLIVFVLNAIFLFDIHIYGKLVAWKTLHKAQVTTWLSALAEMDALISFATFAFNNREMVVYPTISNDTFTFEAMEMGHPLLPPSVRINNSIAFAGKPSVIIITGANMAGKSTFLRTLSVNLLLALNGAPVCAKEFRFSPCDIMSSIKIQDSLSNNESYFYAELVRLKEIIDHVHHHPRTLVILDEILRGTNTKDKQTGSLGLLEKLINQQAVVIIATHDLVIGELEQKYPDIVANHCFEVELTNDQLIFDYTLKKGISKKLNASFLMRKMEIIE